MTLPAPAIPQTLPPFLKTIRWRWWFILWGALLVNQVLLLSNNAAMDTYLWRTTRWVTGDKSEYKWGEYKAQHANKVDAPFFQSIDPPMTVYSHGVPEARFYKRTEEFWRLGRDLGEPLLTAIIVMLLYLYDRRKWKASFILLTATIGSGVVSTLIRATAGRYRPEFYDGASQWMLFRGFQEGTDLAWPSGHATLGFATAAVLIYFSPRGWWLYLWLAGCCAVARVVMNAHFWSDVNFGSVLGWTIGWFTARLLDRWMRSVRPVTAL